MGSTNPEQESQVLIHGINDLFQTFSNFSCLGGSTGLKSVWDWHPPSVSKWPPVSGPRAAGLAKLGVLGSVENPDGPTDPVGSWTR